MVGLLLIGFIMVFISVAFSIAELNCYIDAVGKHKNRFLGLFLEVKKLFPFIIDVVVTVFLASFLGFGNGVVGGVTGIFAANLISAYLWYRGHMRNNPLIIKE